MAARELIVDLHVHSHYSRATSKNCTIEGLYFWGKKKGINMIGTGDFTHPNGLPNFVRNFAARYRPQHRYTRKTPQKACCQTLTNQPVLKVPHVLFSLRFF
ncbi:MAG TPA: hypothetical protein VJR27_05400 [Candidatus Saccharimonadales bacterium]|nr:hypothetical protein [Candidatus Saccharimonadales bacterium]